jgi:hypothetical protein
VAVRTHHGLGVTRKSLSTFSEHALEAFDAA